MKKRLLKTIELENAELYCLYDNRRILTANSQAEVEIYECSSQIPVMGINTTEIKKTHYTLVLCDNMEYTRDVNEEFLSKVKAFEVCGDIQRPDGIFEVVSLRNIVPKEIEFSGKWIFEINDVSEITNILKRCGVV